MKAVNLSARKLLENGALSYIDSCDDDSNLMALTDCDHRTIVVRPFIERRADTGEQRISQTNGWRGVWEDGLTSLSA